MWWEFWKPTEQPSLKVRYIHLKLGAGVLWIFDYGSVVALKDGETLTLDLGNAHPGIEFSTVKRSHQFGPFTLELVVIP